MREVKIWVIVGILSLFGVVGSAYAGLEDSGSWGIMRGSGSWALEQRELSVQAGQQEFYVTRKVDFDDIKELLEQLKENEVISRRLLDRLVS
ncbi:MAG: hypothetical protein AAB296_06325 [Candidatus Desantisbacteria bacterium]